MGTQILGKLNVPALLRNNVDSAELVRHTILLQEYLWTVRSTRTRTQTTMLRGGSAHSLAHQPVVLDSEPLLDLVLKLAGVAGAVPEPARPRDAHHGPQGRHLRRRDRRGEAIDIIYIIYPFWVSF